MTKKNKGKRGAPKGSKAYIAGLSKADAEAFKSLSRDLREVVISGKLSLVEALYADTPPPSRYWWGHPDAGLYHETPEGEDNL